MLPEQHWLPFADPGTHFDTLHGKHHERVAVCTSVEGAQWKERVFSHDMARAMASNIAGDAETYLSQSGLAFRRTVADVRVLNCHWVDLDTYNSEHAGLTSDAVQALVLAEYPWLPKPTMIVNSGRGMHFQWVFREPVLAADVLPKWQVTQDVLTTLLAPFGADPKARDAARVLRLVGSTNDRNGELVTGYRDVGAGVDFAKFARLVAKHQPLPPGPVEAAPRKRRKYASAEAAGRARLNDYNLVLARMRDCHTLAELRGAPLRDGRHRLLYVYGVAGAWYWGSVEQARRELNAFSEQHFADHTSYGAKCCRTILDRMANAKTGAVAQIWQGRPTDYRYKMRNANIIRELEITPAEQEHMQTLIGKDEKARRRRIRDGAKPWGEHVAMREKQAQERLQEAVRLRGDGLTQAEIAKRMGVSERHVRRLLSGA
jgi:hypothetical protein